MCMAFSTSLPRTRLPPALWLHSPSPAFTLSHPGSRLLVELDTGGNIRLEDGKPSDLWHGSCIDLGRHESMRCAVTLWLRAVRVWRVTAMRGAKKFSHSGKLRGVTTVVTHTSCIDISVPFASFIPTGWCWMRSAGRAGARSESSLYCARCCSRMRSLRCPVHCPPAYPAAPPVTSRFYTSDFDMFGIDGIAVHRVTRVHNRFLRTRFEVFPRAELAGDWLVHLFPSLSHPLPACAGVRRCRQRCGLA